MSIGIAVIGAGRWGPHLIRNFASDSRSTVEWVVEVDASRRVQVADRFPGLRVTDDMSAVLGDESVQGVIVATPSATHHGVVSEALSAGKHVLVEKPLATNLDDARELDEHARARGLILMVGHVFLFNPAIRAAADIIRSGDLGEVHYLSMLRTNLGPVRSDSNAAWDLASHDISIANYWLDAVPESVSANGGSFLNPGIEDVVFGTLRYASGVLVHIHASWLNPRKSRFITAVGSSQMLTVNDMDITEPLRIYDKGVAKVEFTPVGVQDTYAQFRSQIRDGQVTIPVVSAGEPLTAECSSFLDRIDGGSDTVSNGTTGVDVVRVLAAMDRSMSSNAMEVPVD
jgi:predicted dehydrogenase